MHKSNDLLNKIKPWIILSTYIVIIFFIGFNFPAIYYQLSYYLSLLSPLFIAIGIAFVLNIPMSTIERIIKKIIPQKSWFYSKIRGVSILLTFVFTFAIISIISSIIFPQIITSIVMLFNNISTYLANISGTINTILEFFHIDLNIDFNFNTTEINGYLSQVGWSIDKIIKTATDWLSGAGNLVFTNALAFTNGLANWFMGLMLSLYLLSSKEKFIRQFRKLIVSILGYRRSTSVFAIGNRAHLYFANFISGQLLEACILGILFYIGMTLLKMPFAMLISSIIGISSIVPMFGALFGMAVGCFLILAVNPMQVLWFIIFFQVLQQLEGNLIYPHVVGNSVGLPGLWVLLSIVVFGGLFGLLGMLIAVPTTALIYSVLGDIVNERLKQKKLIVTETTLSEEAELPKIDS